MMTAAIIVYVAGAVFMFVVLTWVSLPIEDWRGRPISPRYRPFVWLYGGLLWPVLLINSIPLLWTRPPPRVRTTIIRRKPEGKHP